MFFTWLANISYQLQAVWHICVFIHSYIVLCTKEMFYTREMFVSKTNVCLKAIFV